MSDIDFNNGFLCGLLATGIPIGGTGTGTAGTDELPSVDQLDITNLDYYRENFGDGTTYLSLNAYTTILSSTYSYMPKTNGLVLIGGVSLHDFETDDWQATPECMLKITVDGSVIYEDNMDNYFEGGTANNPPNIIQYKNSFDISAKRLNLTDGMQIELMQTLIIGFK